VGELKILSMEDRTATALITKSISRILKGDRFRVKVHAPEIMPVSQSLQQSLDDAPTLPPSPSKFQVQNVASETRISLGDLIKQLRFESGEATIKPEGYQVLDELIAYLKTAVGDRLIRVEAMRITWKSVPRSSRSTKRTGTCRKLGLGASSAT
jgi:chemotaxis protein MotB